MEIVGLGSQILEVARVRLLLERHADAFLERVFTEGEQSYCGGRVHAAEHYAAVWAAKEATLRSLGLNWHRAIPWTGVAVHWEGARPATVRVSGVVRDAADALQVRTWHLTMAHCRAYATATVIAARA